MISPIGIFEWMKANPKEARFIILNTVFYRKQIFSNWRFIR